MTSRNLRVSDAKRPLATWEHRRFPQGWSAAEAAALAEIPKRTVQLWRTQGFFVPALPGSVTGHPEGELYSLGDVVTLRVMRILLDAGADREVAARVGEDAPCWEGEQYIPLRQIAVCEPAWWYFAPLYRDLLPDGELTPIWMGDRVDARLAGEPDVRRSDGLVWLGPKPRCAVWIPFSEICAEIAGKADAWRRQRRVALKHWPGWM